MGELNADLLNDVATISDIEAVPTILQVVCNSTGMGFAAVARVTEGRWIACSILDQIDFGLKPGNELKIETTICHEIRQSREGVVIDDVARDEIYSGHPTPAMYGFQSYISMPIIRRDGSMFGTLSAIDPRPHRLKTPGTIGMFKLFAELIALHIDSVSRLATSEANLTDERKTAELREQFIAVLGHDLCNPLASIDSGIRLLNKRAVDEYSREIIGMMRNSTARMNELVKNILDLARVRLGGGFHLDRVPVEHLPTILEGVIAELRYANAEHVIEMSCHITEPVDCDSGRIAQLFSNLLGNAIRHGDAKSPVRACAMTADGLFKLSVANSGDPIPPTEIKRLFQPYVRGRGADHPQGLGLGLYIASEIARAHGGILSVSSSTEETRFTFQMPLL
jgi:K+-sensing histidine kinase KdpD